MLLNTFDEDSQIDLANKFSFQDAEDRKHEAITAEMWARLDERKARLNMGGYED
jgi:hypothetical protein